MKISLIIPSRNNLKYLKWSYDSIRKNQGNHEVEICVADDASTDGTWAWCQSKMSDDARFNAIRNDGPERLGLVILNDRLIDEVATNDICMVFHADMYLCHGALDAIEKNLTENTIVSLTRIEPPLHPPGPEKIVEDFGVEPETFKEDELRKWLLGFLTGDTISNTEGIFAPWAFYKKDFLEIGGHDKLFAPQSKEDSDIFNRFQLNGIRFIQTWEGFVYHMTSRGSRFNPYSGGAPGQNSAEWIGTMRNFIRKWGQAVRHDEHLKPVISPKYDIGLIVKNCNDLLLKELEPWCSTIYSDADIQNYIILEQQNTIMDLYDRVKPYDNEKQNAILVEMDASLFSKLDFQYITQLPDIISTDDELKDLVYELQTKNNTLLDSFELGNLKITISNLKTTEKDLIICKK